jgi:hypothetical protein
MGFEFRADKVRGTGDLKSAVDENGGEGVGRAREGANPD